MYKNSNISYYFNKQILIVIFSGFSLTHANATDFEELNQELIEKSRRYEIRAQAIKEKHFADLEKFDYKKLPENMVKSLKNSDSKNVFSANKEAAQRRQNDLMIFISHSVPQNLLKEYVIEARKYGGVLIFRGFIDNSLKKTISFVKNLHKEGVAAAIDPKSFKEFNIESVPAILIMDAKSSCLNCTPIHDKIFGSVSLKYALEIFKDEGDNKNLAAKIIARGGDD